MKKCFIAQSIILFSGVLFAWSTVASDYIKFTNNQAANPITTPCFYGAIGFAVFYVFSLYILFTQKNFLKLQKYLVIFLFAGTLFGWGNFIIELCRFYIFKNPTTCSGGFGSNPFLTPCFIGSLLYLLSFVVGTITYRKLTAKK